MCNGREVLYMLYEYWELRRSELNTPGDMGGEKTYRVARTHIRV